MKCYMCERKSSDYICDSKGTAYFLCNVCLNKFEFCEICDKLVLGEELAENGLCDECNSEDIDMSDINLKRCL